MLHAAYVEFPYLSYGILKLIEINVISCILNICNLPQDMHQQEGEPNGQPILHKAGHEPQELRGQDDVSIMTILFVLFT